MLRRTNIPGNNSGFSLIEAMITTMIMGIAFTGVFALTTYSTMTLKNSTDRQKLQLIANQMLEVIDGDVAYIDNYNMDFTTCSAPTSGQIEEYHQNRYKWCRMITDAVGEPSTGDERSIEVTNTADGKIVHIILQSRKGNALVVMKNIYD